MSDNNTELRLEFDDEHPLFTLIWEHSKAGRQPAEPLSNGGPPSPELITIELRAGDTVQKFSLMNIASVMWEGARMRMVTDWWGPPPTTVTATITPPSAAAQTGTTTS